MNAFTFLVTATCLAGATLSLPAAPPVTSQGAKPLISEDFESTKDGDIPKGYTKAGAVSVVSDVAHTGKKSLRLDSAERGARRIIREGPEVAALGSQHWGRLYYKVKLPTPAPVVPEGKKFAVIHSTLVGGKATSPLHSDPIEVRVVDTVLGSNGSFQYLYNVQPRKRPEFATGSKYRFQYSDQWTLVEWFVDHATQTYRFYVNGEEVPETTLNKGAGQFAGAEIPAAFESIFFGWCNYQAAGEGFTAWIDDIAVGKERLGPVAAAGVKK